jgi:phage shock protein C
MYCNFCGKVIQDDAHLCAYCGRRVGMAVSRKPLMRSRRDRKVAGVCAGLAEHFDLDVTLVRVVWVVLTLVPPAPMLLAYVVLWIVMPEEPETQAVTPVVVSVPDNSQTA